MITFSVYLQENAKKKEKYKDKIAEEEKRYDEYKVTYEHKHKEFAELEKKEMRIQRKKNALLKYEQYLEGVRGKNSDEFSEISDILFRHKTLIKENQKLNEAHFVLDNKLNTLKDSTTKYIKEKSNEIMKLNNEISKKKEVLEQIINE